MAVGDLITRDGQYEFNGLLFNAYSTTDTVKVLSCEGLFDLPPFKGTTSELGDDHGGVMNRHLLGMRYILMDIVLLASSKSAMYTTSRTITSILQPSSTEAALVFQRAGIGKQFVNARVRRFSGFRNEHVKERGRSPAAIEFVCPDPRKLAMVQSSQAIVIASGNTSQSGTVEMIGNFNGGAKPILEILGPVTNPRITNANDENRGIRLDVVVGVGSTLILDVAKRTATMGGVDVSSTIRTDNQWWNLMRGNNLITFTRSNSPANTGTLTVKWWNSYV